MQQSTIGRAAMALRCWLNSLLRLDTEVIPLVDSLILATALHLVYPDPSSVDLS